MTAFNTEYRNVCIMLWRCHTILADYFWVTFFFIRKHDCSDAPEISVPNRRIGQKLGGEVVLECIVAAVPPASLYWMRDRVPVALSSKYVTDKFDELDGRVTLTLTICDLQPNDYDDYQCVAGNQLGRTNKTITLYGSLSDTLVLA